MAAARESLERAQEQNYSSGVQMSGSMAGEAKERVYGAMLFQCSANVKNTRKTKGLPAVARVKKGPGSCLARTPS